MLRPMIIAAVLASVSASALASETITYLYDARGRLVQVAHAGTVNNGVVTSYGLDKADNRISVAVTGGGAATGGGPSFGFPVPGHRASRRRAPIDPMFSLTLSGRASSIHKMTRSGSA